MTEIWYRNKKKCSFIALENSLKNTNIKLTICEVNLIVNSRRLYTNRRGYALELSNGKSHD